ALTDVEARVVCTASSLTVRLTAPVPVEHSGRDVTTEFKLAAGVTLAEAQDQVGSDAVPRACSGEEAEALSAATVAFRRDWLSPSRGRWPEVVQRSALSQKLIYAPTGAI